MRRWLQELYLIQSQKLLKLTNFSRQIHIDQVELFTN